MKAEDDKVYKVYNEERRAQTRSGSFVPSAVSMKSDKSMKTPIELQNGNVLDQRRDNSPEPSAVSLKSDKSMKTPIEIKDGDSPGNQSFQQRDNSPDPSVWSLKSDKSMKTPIELQNEHNPGNQRFSQTKSYQDTPTAESFPGKSIHQQDSETHEEKILRLKSNIRKKHQYIFEGFARQGNPTLLNEIYVDLYITEGGNGEISNEHEYKRIEKSLKSAATATIPIKCSEILTPLPGQNKAIRTVLTKGVAGIGKTVSVQKFILDWAEEKENQDVQLIFPLPFREINLMKDKTLSLSDLLQLFFPQTKEMEISSDKYKVLFILDGLDECRLPLNFKRNETLRDVTKTSSVDVLLTNLIVGNLLPSALIWITSRPAAADLIPSECVHRVTEVRGFNDPQKEEYFSKRISDQILANTIISHLKSSRSLYIMCQIPVFCWISATVLEKMLSEAETAEIPKTLTQMYTHFLMTQINIKGTKYNEKKVEDKEMILKLGKLAYEQLEKGNIIFYEEDLRECGIDVAEASVYSGLCTQIFREEFGLYQGKVFSFIHLSIQEHLAALYVHLSFHNNDENVLEPQKSGEQVTMLSIHTCAVDKTLQSMNGRFDLFLRFLMGLSLQSNLSLLKDLLVKKPGSSLKIEKTTDYLKEKLKIIPCSERALVVFHCLNELNDHSLITEKQIYQTRGDIKTNTLSSDHWLPLVYILMTSNEKFEEFQLPKYGRLDDALLWLLPVIKLSKRILLDDCNITYKGCGILSMVLSYESNVRELDLSNNNLQDAGVEILCGGIKKSPNMKSLVQEWFKMKQIDLDKLHNSYEDYICLTAGLQDTECKLESLNLTNCGVTEEGCVFLSKALILNCTYLKELNLSCNPIGGCGVKHLCAALEKVHCALEIMILAKCGLTDKSCAALASALSSKTSLKNLDLSINDLQDSGVKTLCVGLQNPHCKLQKLRLSNCNVTHEGLTALTVALKSSPSQLKELDLLENDLEESDLNMIYMIMDKSSDNE
ncbi:NACHT, LRR and PYD domains-containing protein 3-like isoform X3 [Danio aesculapii]|uniref:NACHT, LRR and PYD domains-containing protein 3-like isoform X3 n=1 Tax=Danio aesculapii TaxID=1142201 RepID=UPI0024BFA8DD|nr:NACHT, LRR and PYD domains-containing protein 3-like isoform X3 [Danio aesculapii]